MAPLWREVRNVLIATIFCFHREVKAGLNRGQR